MQRISQGWKLFRTRLLHPNTGSGLQVKPNVLTNTKPLYEQRPPWWARFTYTLIIADLVVTASMAELAFDGWTEEKAPAKDQVDAPKAGTSKGVVLAAEDTEKEYVLRPLWQRLPAATVHIVIGAAIAFGIFTSHARIVRRIRIVPASRLVRNDAYASLVSAPTQRFVFMQTATATGDHGDVFPMEACTLERGVDDKEMKLSVKGTRGPFWLGLSGAKINGEEKSLWNTREALYTTFYGKEGTKIMTRLEGQVA